MCIIFNKRKGKTEIALLYLNRIMKNHTANRKAARMLLHLHKSEREREKRERHLRRLCKTFFRVAIDETFFFLYSPFYYYV